MSISVKREPWGQSHFIFECRGEVNSPFGSAVASDEFNYRLFEKHQEIVINSAGYTHGDKYGETDSPVELRIYVKDGKVVFDYARLGKVLHSYSMSINKFVSFFDEWTLFFDDDRVTTRPLY